MSDDSELRAIVRSLSGRKGALIPALQAVQARWGHLPPKAIGIIADELRIPASTVYGVATFYAQFRLSPRGRHTVKVCLGTACHVRGSASLLEAVAAELGVRPGETTADGLFTLESVACLGACGLSPVMMVDDVAYGRLTADRISDILERYRSAGSEEVAQ